MTIWDVAAGQHAAFSLAQARTTGVSKAELDWWVATGRLRRVAPEVFVVAGSPDTWRQRVMITCLTEGGVASHQTAAALHGLRGFGPAIIHVKAVRWRRRKRTGVRVHESTDLTPDDVVHVDGIPCTDLVLTLIDLGATCHPHRVGAALDEAVRQRWTTYSAVRQKLKRIARRGRRGAGVMRRLLDERPGGAKALERSELEKKLTRLLAKRDLPPSVANHEVTVRGEKFEIDRAWPELKVGIEVQSEERHLDLHHFHRDPAKILKLTADGWNIVEFTSACLYAGSTFLADLAAVLELASHRAVQQT